ncbi:MAG: peroxidase-related enzyme [Rhodobacteraceae bacterium]|nr:peroxidase-related enzyme [Paracoccaceae bacterium]
MPLLPSLPDAAHLSDLLVRYPDHVQTLMALTNQVMRDDGALDVATRELIAAYVSGLNACQFCHGSHRLYAEVFGIAPELIDAVLDDLQTAPIDPSLRPVLAYAAKLNTLPSRLVPADSQAILDAGWPEAAIFDVVEVVALFNFYNRLVEGAGVNFSYDGAEGHSAFAPDSDHSRSYLNYADRIAEQVKTNAG